MTTRRATCVKPAINKDFFGKVFAFVVARKQGIPPYTYFSTWCAWKCIISHFRNRFQTSFHIGHWWSYCAQHIQLIRYWNKCTRTSFCQAYMHGKRKTNIKTLPENNHQSWIEVQNNCRPAKFERTSQHPNYKKIIEVW